ncbi:MAG: HAD family hydrolase [Planctomycetota bacterium]|nr:HAD family hydrolase [Planctomycetota bacterium]
MITSVAFDLDDTLYDEIEYCKSGFVAVAEFLANLPDKLPVGLIFEAFWKQFTAGNRTKTFNAGLDQLGISYDDKLIEELVKVYRSHRPKIKLPQDSRDVLCRLSGKWTLALLTDGFLPAQQLKVQALGLERYFKCIIYTEQLGRQFWKPSPAGFEKLMETLNTKPENIAYVADNLIKDFIAPKKLGFSTIQIIRPRRILREPCEKIGAAAQYVIHQLTELPALLEQL